MGNTDKLAKATRIVLDVLLRCLVGILIVALPVAVAYFAYFAGVDSR